MKVSLITASTFSRLDATPAGQPLDEDSPLGILSLAASLRARGIGVVVHDLTQFLRERVPVGQDGCAPAAEWIQSSGADVFAFSTICSTYPLTLRLADEVRRCLPDRPIILGGPQATVTDCGVLQAFPSVDVVVRGEGDYVLPDVLEALGGRTPLADIRGIAFRRDGAACRTADAPVILDLDDLPDPAYDLDPLMRRRRFVSLELGRGCPFACEFCSTNDFFRRKFRLKSPARVIAQMVQLNRDYGHTRFSLVHDMFTVDRRKVVAFCEAMRAANTGFQWTCSARTDSVDPELLEMMAGSGCVSVFFGVESGSQDQQRRMRKDLDVARAREVVACATRLGLSASVSLIVGFPDETPADFRQTVSFMIDAARHDRAEPRLHLLAPLVGTPLAVRYRDQVQLHEDIYSDASVSSTGLRPGSPERALITAHRDLFLNFYLMPMQLPPAYLNEVRLFLSTGVRRFRWLLIALDQEVGSIVDVFDQWLAWRPKPEVLPLYYHHRAFVRDLLAFLTSTYYQRGYPASDVLLRYARALFDHGMAAEHAPTIRTNATRIVPYQRRAVPRLAPGAQLLAIQGSVPAVIDALRAGQSPTPAETQRHADLLLRPAHDEWQAVSELAPLTSSVLRLCDGRRRVSHVLDAFAEHGTSIAGASPEAVCDFTLRNLGHLGLLQFTTV